MLRGVFLNELLKMLPGASSYSSSCKQKILEKSTKLILFRLFGDKEGS